MGPADKRVWEAALDAHIIEYDRYEYDVRLGGEASHLVPDEHELKPMWLTLLKKRVDVVAWRGKVPTVIEVKEVASFAALGQCLGYGWLWRKEMPTGIPVGMMCVCAVSDPDLSPVFAAYGVDVVALPPERAALVLARHQVDEWTR